MADYESDIDEDLLAEAEAEEIEDDELENEIEAALNEEREYEYIDAPEDEDLQDDEVIDPNEENSSGDEEEKIDELKDASCDTIDATEASTEAGESVIDTITCTKRDHIQIREIQSAYDSRMPDIPTIFELGGLIISRACTLAANSPPLVQFDIFDPAKIARNELIQGKALRAVLRGDTRWRWSDFNYFPRGFMNEDDTTEKLHEVR